MHAFAAIRCPGAALEGEIADRIQARPRREGVSGERMQTFDPRRHATGGDSRQLWHIFDAAAIGEVRLVCSEIAGCSPIVVKQPRKLEHDPCRFERRHRDCGGRMAEVVERGERLSAREPRLGGDDRWRAAQAPGRDADHPARRATELLRHDADVAVRR